jgi:cell division protein FtsQ
VRAGILSPRAVGRAYEDIGDRPAPIARQRVRRDGARRLRRTARAVTVGLVAGVVLVGGGIAGHFLLTAPAFAVIAVEVRGASRLSPADVIRVSGIRPGVNLFRVDTSDVARRLEALAEIRRAEVIRALPNRVTIIVEERRPFTLVHAGRLHWIDEDGAPMGVEHRAVAPRVPVISGLTPEELATMREQPSPRARMGIALIRALLRSGSPLASEISEIDVSRPDGPVLYTLDGVEVRLGAENWETRLPRLEGVLRQIATASPAVTLVDLRFRDQVVLNGGSSR